jgi:hypothetical protein
MYTIKIPNIDPKWVVLGGAVAGSLLLGGGGGYFIAVKKLNKEYDARLIEELQETKEFIQFTTEQDQENEIKEAVEEILDEVDTIQPAARAMVNYAGVEKVEDDEVLKAYDVLNRVTKDEVNHEEVVNVFDKGEEPWDYAKEMASRDPLFPYIISEDEFMENEGNREQTQVTYFQGDDILADAKDEVISDVNGTVGEDNLTRFGHGSENENIVFVRNEKLDLEFEVERSFGSFAEEVQGFIKHAHTSQKSFRFRGDDE